jgi:hypothetical protein
MDRLPQLRYVSPMAKLGESHVSKSFGLLFVFIRSASVLLPFHVVSRDNFSYFFGALKTWAPLHLLFIFTFRYQSSVPILIVTRYLSDPRSELVS